MNRLGAVLALAAIWPALATAGERWRLQYFYDPPEDAEFAIAALAFPSARVGFAAGSVRPKWGKPKPYAVATADGGKTWTPARVPASAVSLFFLDERTGWLVEAGGAIWHTDDGGHNWTRATTAPNAGRVYFRDRQRGWAVGDKKSVWQTSDGGVTWTAVEEAAKPETSIALTGYSAIAFASANNGLIVGWSMPPRPGEQRRRSRRVDPESQPRGRPGVAISLQTQDGGATWKESETSMFGLPIALSLAPNGEGLLLIEFFEYLGRFDYPSEVYHLDLTSGNSTRSFRRKHRVVTDVLAEAKGPSYLAAVEPAGTLFQSPLPGKLKILKSDDLENWDEMEVDYRGVARSARLASPDGVNVWVGTDTGMILKLVPE